MVMWRTANPFMGVRFPPWPLFAYFLITLLLIQVSHANAEDEIFPTPKEGKHVTFETDKSNKKTYSSNSKFGNTPLMNAVREKNYGTVLSLLNNGVDPNAHDIANVTALHIAAESNFKDVIMLLIQKGANINEISDGNFTPLMYAAAEGNYDIVKTLIEYGADTSISSNEGKTALDYAIQSENIQSLKHILTKAHELSKRQLDYSISYAKQFPNSKQSIDLINKSVINTNTASASDKNILNTEDDKDDKKNFQPQQKSDKQQENNTKKQSSLKNMLHSKSNNNAPKNKNTTKKQKTKYTNYTKNKNYYILYVGAFVGLDDANNYWDIIKSKNRWLNNLYHNIEKEQLYKSKQVFYDLFLGVFEKESDAKEMQLLLNKINVSTTILTSSTIMNNMRIVNIEKTKQNILKEEHKKQTSNNQYLTTQETTEDNNHQATETQKNYSEYYILNFGIFISNEHAKKYWNSVSKIKWMSQFNPVYGTAIHSNIEKPVVSLHAGAMVDYDLTKNMVDILSSLGIRVKLNKIDYLPQGMDIVTKDQLFKKFNYYDAINDNYTNDTNSSFDVDSDIESKIEKESKKNKKIKIKVKEAIFLDDLQSASITKNNNTSSIGFRISYYKNRYTAAVALTKAYQHFHIDSYSIRTNNKRKALLYITVSNTSDNAVCNYFIEKQYNCTVFLKNDE